MAKNKVLVVDDEPGVRFGIRDFLEQHGYEVEEAESCREAQRLFRTSRPDIVIADYMMSDGTALDLVSGLPTDRRPRVAIVLSGFDSVDDIQRTLQAGFDAHLAKPTPLDVLREVIAQGLRRSASGVRLAQFAIAPKASPAKP